MGLAGPSGLFDLSGLFGRLPIRPTLLLMIALCEFRTFQRDLGRQSSLAEYKGQDRFARVGSVQRGIGPNRNDDGVGINAQFKALTRLEFLQDRLFHEHQQQRRLLDPRSGG